MATTITAVTPTYGKAGDVLDIIGTGFLDSGSLSVVLVRKHGDTAWTAVAGAQAAYSSGTKMLLALHATEFPTNDPGLYDVGVADYGETTPDQYLESAIFHYIAGVFDPNAVIKGSPKAVYVDGRLVGHTHGKFDLDHEVSTSDVVVNESLIPVRTIKSGETFGLSVPLAEISLENLQAVWGIDATIVTHGARRTLTFGGDVDVVEKPILVILPAGAGKEWAVTFYRCAIVAPGTLSWNRDDQVDLPLKVTVLADTSRAVGDQVGRIDEYTPTP